MARWLQLRAAGKDDAIDARCLPVVPAVRTGRAECNRSSPMKGIPSMNHSNEILNDLVSTGRDGQELYEHAATKA